MGFGKGLVASVLAFGMILGVGVSTGVVGTGDVSAASIERTKKPGDVTYRTDLGLTSSYKGDRYRGVYVNARGIINRRGTAADLGLIIDSKTGVFQKHHVTYYKKSAKGNWIQDGSGAVSGKGAIHRIQHPSNGGTYYVVIHSQYKNAKGGYDKYTSATTSFYHSASIGGTVE